QQTEGRFIQLERAATNKPKTRVRATVREHLNDHKRLPKLESCHPEICSEQMGRCLHERQLISKCERILFHRKPESQGGTVVAELLCGAEITHGFRECSTE